MTASFFHTLTETLCALALVAMPLAAHGNVLGAHIRWSTDEAAAALCALWAVEAAAMWVVRARGGLDGGTGSSGSRLAKQCVYDAVLWAAFWALQTSRAVRIASGLPAIPFDRTAGRRPLVETRAGGAGSSRAASDADNSRRGGLAKRAAGEVDGAEQLLRQE